MRACVRKIAGSNSSIMLLRCTAQGTVSTHCCPCDATLTNISLNFNLNQYFIMFKYALHCQSRKKQTSPWLVPLELQSLFVNLFIFYFLSFTSNTWLFY